MEKNYKYLSNYYDMARNCDNSNKCLTSHLHVFQISGHIDPPGPGHIGAHYFHTLCPSVRLSVLSKKTRYNVKWGLVGHLEFPWLLYMSFTLVVKIFVEDLIPFQAHIRCHQSYTYNPIQVKGTYSLESCISC